MKKSVCIGMAVLILCMGGCGLNNGKPTDSALTDEAMEVGLTAYVNIENSICIEEQDLVADEEIENTSEYAYVWSGISSLGEGGHLWKNMMESTDITDTEWAKLERFQSIFLDEQEFCLVCGDIEIAGVETENATIDDWWTYISDDKPRHPYSVSDIFWFSLIDMDGDGNEELLLDVFANTFSCYLIFWEKDGTFVAKWYWGHFRPVTENGIGILCEMETDLDYQYLHVCFDKENDYRDECIATVRWTDLSLKEAESATIGGESVTIEEYEQWIEEKESVEWYRSAQFINDLQS